MPSPWPSPRTKKRHRPSSRQIPAQRAGAMRVPGRSRPKGQHGAIVSSRSCTRCTTRTTDVRPRPGGRTRTEPLSLPFCPSLPTRCLLPPSRICVVSCRNMLEAPSCRLDVRCRVSLTRCDSTGGEPPARQARSAPDLSTSYVGLVDDVVVSTVTTGTPGSTRTETRRNRSRTKCR